ncbi:WD40 repeat domain-containing protein [Ningiella sp. W23]|uniref:WD40 repeat domain-containing protein n=1 Tax=Ningiella sp. W23 TaxID=3023715 RepID=UPI003756C0D9
MHLIKILARTLLLMIGTIHITACHTSSSPELSTTSSSADSPQQQAPYLHHVITLMGDPDGRIDTYFEDNSVATEAVEFSPNGELFASVSKSKNTSARLRLWRRSDYKMLWEQTLSGETESVAFSLDGQWIVAGGEDDLGSGVLYVFAVTNEKQVLTNLSTGFSKSIEGMRFSPNGKMLAIGDEAGFVSIIATHMPNPEDWYIIGRHSVKNSADDIADVNQVDWTSDSAYLVTAERDGDVHLYSALSLVTEYLPRPIRRYEGFTGNTVKSVRISSDNTMVAAGAGGTMGVMIWDFESAELISHIRSEHAPRSNSAKVLNAERYESVAFSPDSQHLVVGGTWPAWWFAANQQENLGYKVPLTHFDIIDLKKQVAADAPIQFQHYDAWRTEYIDFNTEGDLVVTGHDDGSIRLWRVNSP